MIGNELPKGYCFDYGKLRRKIKSGDILICSGSGVFSKLIQGATDSVWSHVGFILRLDAIDRIMVLESVENIGVRTVPLSSYQNDYNGTSKHYPGEIFIARHNNFKEESIKCLSQFSIDRLGYPYNTDEIARIAARITLSMIGKIDINEPEFDAREFICSEYVHMCFKSVGINIPHDPRGFIAPADFAKCKNISLI